MRYRNYNIFLSEGNPSVASAGKAIPAVVAVRLIMLWDIMRYLGMGIQLINRNQS